MKPFKLWVEWYGDVATVELHVLSRVGDDWIEDDPKVLRTFPTALEAVAWAVKWFGDRGIHYHHHASLHERRGHKHVILHAVGRVSETSCCNHSEAAVR